MHLKMHLVWLNYGEVSIGYFVLQCFYSTGSINMPMINFCNKVVRHIEEFCLVTKLHGLHWIVDEKYTRIER